MLTRLAVDSLPFRGCSHGRAKNAPFTKSPVGLVSRKSNTAPIPSAFAPVTPPVRVPAAVGDELIRLPGSSVALNVGPFTEPEKFTFQLFPSKTTIFPPVSAPLLLPLTRQQRKARALTALEIVGLGERAKHKPSQLSGGQQQRVAIARAIVADPQLLICDEPTGDLDRRTADDILALMQTLNREHGKTIVMVTHDPKAAGYAQTVLHMDKGTLAGVAA